MQKRVDIVKFAMSIEHHPHPARRWGERPHRPHARPRIDTLNAAIQAGGRKMGSALPLLSAH
ncbi:hypothetical protein BN2497_11999 [Janthinobacterium sp. CG23_2]|nr:hypothetical protein BN2497_11999 [Janthinobacterium sp. CG23_2]CUU32397.1 hypothetical protein BN3177_11999 [Janthinobacterium sp. CG23_2]